MKTRPLEVTTPKQKAFDSNIDWNPVQSAKMRCHVICPGSFQDEIRVN